MNDIVIIYEGYIHTSIILCQENVSLGNIEIIEAVVFQGHCMIVERYPGT